ncbi:MAG TPA: glycosyl transferase family 2 [Lachnospiraceae bacterium]|nr:glycosyltransferase [Lachnospiraceae bacterium]HAL31367.1 glycosyl transferase family 2 [Lachnospiraceae bacterium]HBB59595.1 glycosyl transferase family 2 [Lachnospiraceae bacterium]HCR99856.1 glycosyl transferase family 2 [Lachnospiraceae bacterium]
MEKTADVVILTHKPSELFLDIIDRLEEQSLKPRKIIVMNTGESHMDDLLGRYPDRLKGYDNIEIHHITRDEFDHGGTRKRAAEYSDAAFLIYMTQDALPADERLVENLAAPFEGDGSIAVSYARQLPYESASPIERYNRSFNYPEGDRKKTADDLDTLGIKAFFCSDVCACYRRDIYDSLGGHIEHTVFNEDMIYARGAIDAGYSIYYASDARVYHSHDYTPAQQYRRNVDLGRSQAEHPEVFGGITSYGEGKKLVKGCMSYLLKNGYWYMIPAFIAQCAGRYLGYRKGRRG